jgi:hypothetical protein
MPDLGRFVSRLDARWRWRCLWLDIDLRMVNRPHFALDDQRRWFAISWGNGYSDPVWSLQVGPRRG